MTTWLICVKNCAPCAAVNLPHKKESIPWTPSTEPFLRIHLDFFQYQSTSFLIVVDSYSRWLEVYQMQFTKVKDVISKLLNLFAIFGLPKIMVSDNGPPFDSDEYAQFGTKMDIQILHSPVYHPESNGLAEKSVSVAKRALKKMLMLEPNTAQSDFQTIITRFLFHYRNTPSSVNLKTPCEMLFAFRPRTLLTNLLPVKKDLLKSHFREGETIFVKLHKGSDTVSATVVRPLGVNRYLISIEGVLKEIHHDQMVRSPKI